MLDKILKFLSPLVSQGRTRFLAAMSAMGAVVYLGKDPNVDWKVYVGVVVIAATYIVAKSFIDVKKEKKNGN